MSAEPKVFFPTAPLAADHGVCERCEEDKGTEMYDDRLLCAKCYDEATIGEPHEDYRAEFEQWLDEEEDDDEPIIDEYT
jgi:hypothetical protein